MSERVEMIRTEVHRHSTLVEDRVAVFSDCGLYRFALSIVWDQAKPQMVACMLNPSTASHLENDPTIERVCRRARMLDLGGVVILNLFAWRDTKPEGMKLAADPVGAVVNDNTILDAFRQAAANGWPVLFGWGNHGAYRGRDREVMALAEQAELQPMCLKVSATGQPWHPLYCGYGWPLLPYALAPAQPPGAEP